MELRGSEKKTRDETSNGVVRKNQQVSVREVWRKEHVHEAARKIHRTKKFVRRFWKNGESVNWEVMTSLEEWTDREKF